MLGEMRMDIQKMGTQLDAPRSQSSGLEQQTLLLLRAMQQQQQESSAVAMATINAAATMMIQQGRAPQPPQSQFASFPSPVQTLKPQPPHPNIFSQQVAASASPQNLNASASAKKLMLGLDSPQAATGHLFTPLRTATTVGSFLPQVTVPSSNIFVTKQTPAVPSPAKQLTTITNPSLNVKANISFGLTKETQAKPELPKAATESLFDKFKPKEATKCIACTTAKPGFAPEKSTGGILAKANVSTPQFSFGAATQKTSTVPTTPLFSFGSSTKPATASTKPAFSFGVKPAETKATPESDDEEVQQSRLVMRQDQTFKVCCNHPILPEMKLTMMSTKNKDGSKAAQEQCRAWTWWAIDFAEPIVGETDVTLDENGGHRETLAMRFGKVEAAQEFYRVFHASCQSAKSPQKSTKDQDEVEILNVSHVNDEQKKRAELLKLPKEFYAFENDEKTKENYSTSGLFASPSTANTSGGLFGNLPKASISSGIFGTGTTTTSSESLFAGFGSNKTSSPPSQGLFGNLGKPAAGLFAPGTAEIKEAPGQGLLGDGNKPAGDGNKPGLFGTEQDASADSSKTFGQGLFGPSAPTSSLFNFACKTTSSGDTTIGGFGAAVESKGMLDFTQLNKSSGDGQMKPAWLSKSDDAPKWGTDKPLFANQTEGPSEDADGHVVEDPSYDPQYKAIVSLPEVQVKTGEEDEVCLFLSRSRVYKFLEGEWKERGVGDLKILVKPQVFPSDEVNPREEWPAVKDSDLGTLVSARILMRREQVLKLCLNQTISVKTPFNFTPVGASKRVVCWKGVDYSSDEPETELFSLKFKNEETLTHFNECLARAMKLPRV
ncbi:E3 SUMO-protein ligase RanBP2 [Cichlidogyrus casuarinus]|uniref:E3 SUMO-protein ligase RanBP2 n=1 Tax=Cichlidogyrus casuarinus TaxID=1844966 RepID=A0ABD2PNZ3_9PLAT